MTCKSLLISICCFTCASGHKATLSAAHGDVVNTDSECVTGGSIQLLQRASFYKAEKLKSERTPDEAAELQQHSTQNDNGMPCMSTGHPIGEAPLSYEAIFHLQAMRELGITRHAIPCHNNFHKPSLLQVSTQQKWHNNRAAKIVVVCWGSLCLFFVAWSVISVMMVPRKNGPWDKTPPGKLRLADDERAWNRGRIHWLGLSWVDNLMGRYGKCSMAVMEEIEINPERCPEDFKPHKDFVALWHDQIKKRGKKNASLVRVVLGMIGTRGCVGIFAAGLFQIILQQVGMVVGLDVFLGYLGRHAIEVMVHPGVVEDMLNPTLLVIFMSFGIPMMYRTSEILVALLDGYYTNICAAGMACCLYQKALDLPVGLASDEERRKFDSSDVAQRPNLVQVMNSDVITTWGYLIKRLVYYSLTPLSSIFLVGMLISHLGWCGVVGMSYMLFGFWMGFKFLNLSFKQYIRMQNFVDHRLRYLVELLTHIRITKSLGFEHLAYERIKRARDGELSANKSAAVVQAISGINFTMVPWLSLFFTLALLHFFGPGVSPRHIFIIHRIMATLMTTIHTMMTGMTELINVPNAFGRVKAFLDQPERPKRMLRPPSLEPGAPLVSVQGSFAYMPTWPPMLKNIDLDIYRGETVAIIGAVGSGKSSLLQAVMGELFPKDDAFIEAPSEVAYQSQMPWIFEGTLRENVLLDRPFQKSRYNEALNAASLMSDLELLPGADEVTIGAQGVRLSGGQKTRVALARAAYMEGSVMVMMDDPFAALDTPTGTHVFDELVLGPLLEGKTKVIVMQPHVPRLKRCDKVVLLQEGTVAHHGKPEDVITTKEFQALLADAQIQEGPKNFADDGVEETQNSAAQEGINAAQEDRTDHIAITAKARKTIKDVRKVAKGEALREQEDDDYFRWTTLFLWIKKGGFINGSFVIFTMVGEKLVGLVQLNLIALWADKKIAGSRQDVFFLSMSALSLLLSISMSIISQLSCNAFSVSAARQIHEKVMESLLAAPIDKFYDKNPVGRLINRLSHDLGIVDRGVLGAVTGVMKFVVSSLVTQSFITSMLPLWVPVVCFPLYATCAVFASLYAGVAVPLVFHFKKTMSVLQDMQGQVLTANVSIRAHGMASNFMARFNDCAITIIRCQYLTYHVTEAWAKSRISLIMCVLSTSFTLGGLWCGLSMGRQAMVIALCFTSIAEFESIAPLMTSFVNILNSLQRIVRYLDIPQERPSCLPGDVKVRTIVKVDRGEVAQLVMKTQDGVVELFTDDGLPLLRGTEGGSVLELVDGRNIQELAPNSSALQGESSKYDLVAVNAVSRDAKGMAHELTHLSQTMWIDLWHQDFKLGARLSFEHVHAGYNTDPDVLKDVSFTIGPRAKVGFAGQTGCGKSTTLLCILGILEARRGRISLNGIDTNDMGLKALRSMIGLVPQDPTVFDGSWRYNMDPFDEYPDGRIWNALHLCRLLPYIRSLQQGLNSRIESGGMNMSMGQRQLLSLARMVVRQPPILLLDECTSALDPAMQEAIQHTLATEFPLSTIVAVAHRIETIMNFGQIVVFKSGSVVEQGSFDEVAQIPNGVFASMLKKHRAL